MSKSLPKTDSKSKKNSDKTFFQKNKKYWPLILLLIFAGFLAGHLPVVFSKKYQNASKMTKTSQARQTTETVKKYKFINPALYTSTYNNVCYDELKDFSEVITFYCKNAIQKKDIESVSYYFRDLTNGHNIVYNENEKYIPASLSKVPLIISVFQIAQNDPAFLSKKVKYTQSFEESYFAEHPELGHQRSFLKDGNYYSILELCNYMIDKSDNEATRILYNETGFEALTKANSKLGYTLPKNSTASTNTMTVKTYSHYFRTLYNASLLSNDYSEMALEILSRADYQLGVRKAVPSNIVVSQKFGERDTLTSPTTFEIRQLHQAAIVYYPGKHYFICIMIKGNNKQSLENVLFDLANITHKEVEHQAKSFKIPNLEKDIRD